jgi:hypothetical protein
MPEWLKVFIGFFGGGTAGSLITWLATNRRERRQLIRDFRRKLGTVRSGFERQPAKDLFNLYHDTVPRLQGDVAALKGDLSRRSYRRLRGAADAFAGVARQEIQRPVADGLAIDFETGRQRLLQAIDEVEKAL